MNLNLELYFSVWIMRIYNIKLCKMLNNLKYFWRVCKKINRFWSFREIFDQPWKNKRRKEYLVVLSYMAICFSYPRIYMNSTQACKWNLCSGQFRVAHFEYKGETFVWDAIHFRSLPIINLRLSSKREGTHFKSFQLLMRNKNVWLFFICPKFAFFHSKKNLRMYTFNSENIVEKFMTCVYIIWC